jgi:hypothetical protein
MLSNFLRLYLGPDLAEKVMQFFHSQTHFGHTSRALFQNVTQKVNHI